MGLGDGPECCSWKCIWWGPCGICMVGCTWQDPLGPFSGGYGYMGGWWGMLGSYSINWPG